MVAIHPLCSPLFDLMQANAQWLTSTLTRNGHLARGNVAGVSHERWHQSTHSCIARLTLEYTIDAEGKPGVNLPKTLVLKYKRSKSTIRRDPEYARREFVFHTTVARAMSDLHAPRCYDAAFAPRSGAYHFFWKICRAHTCSLPIRCRPRLRG